MHLEPWYSRSGSRTGKPSPTLSGGIHRRSAYRQKAQEEWKLRPKQPRPEARNRRPRPSSCLATTGSSPRSALPKGRSDFRRRNRRTSFLRRRARSGISSKAELKAIKNAAPPEPPFACAVAEGEPVEQHVFLRGNPESRGEIVSKRFPDRPGGRATAPDHTGQRPARTGRLARRAGESAAGARHGEPDLARTFRRRHGPHSQQLRHHGRAALRIRNCSTGWPASSSRRAGQ